MESGHKLKYRKFHLDVQRNFFIMKVGKDCDRLPKGVVESPLFQITWSPVGHCPQWPALVECAVGSEVELCDFQGSFLILGVP